MPYKNHEGYRDPTAGEAIENASKMPKRIKDIIQIINPILRLHGLEIVAVKDIYSGKIWR